MYRILSLFITFCFLSLQVGYCEDLNKALKATTHAPNFFSVIGSLLFVVCLIYVAGFLHTKLTKFGTSTVKKNLKDFSDIKATVLSTTPLDANKSLHVIEIGGKKMLIASSPNSVNLIKSLDEISLNNYSANESLSAVVTEEKIENIQVKSEQENFEKKFNTEDFGLYKKYLR